MIPAPWERRRLLVPRWRSLALTLDARELAAPPRTRDPHTIRSISPDLLDKLVLWRLDPGLIAAGELLGAALVEAQESKGVDAARLLLSPDSTATAPLRRLAALTLKRAGFADEIPPGLEIHPRADKHVWRQRTRLYPANPLAWVELSLWDVISGRRDAALRPMLVALQLAPNDRHVLRSASRLFLHCGNPERAYDIVAKSAATSADPWLIAAELSLAELAARKPRFFEQGRRIVADGGLLPRQITELAGAIGSLELAGGRRKRARDFFHRSVVDPTGNALAQVEWETRAFGVDLVSARRLDTTAEADEATAFHLIRKEKYAKVPKVCERWSSTEPYSIRPYEIGSTIACQLGSHNEALEITQRGLKIRPEAGTLLNNQAFALTNLGRLKEAERHLLSVRNDGWQTLHLTEANCGLLAMRRGEYVSGLALYRQAIQGFHRQNATHAENVARLYLAREAALARIPEAKELVASAREAMAQLKGTVHQHILQEAEQALAAPRLLKSLLVEATGLLHGTKPPVTGK